jgi:hypothetical protein
VQNTPPICSSCPCKNGCAYNDAVWHGESPINGLSDSGNRNFLAITVPEIFGDNHRVTAGRPVIDDSYRRPASLEAVRLKMHVFVNVSSSVIAGLIYLTFYSAFVHHTIKL